MEDWETGRLWNWETKTLAGGHCPPYSLFTIHYSLFTIHYSLSTNSLVHPQPSPSAMLLRLL